MLSETDSVSISVAPWCSFQISENVGFVVEAFTWSKDENLIRPSARPIPRELWAPQSHGAQRCNDGNAQDALSQLRCWVQKCII